jgi:hypothetical protein
MGWLFHNEKLRQETPVQYITREFTHTSGTRHATVLDAAAVRGTIYAAIRNTDKETGKSYVFCAVILFKNSKKNGFGYKDMDEGMGPCEVDCPNRIMRLLSPVEDMPNPGYAADWRARVAQAKAARRKVADRLGRLKPGDRIRLPTPAHFGKIGISADTFVLIEMRKRTPIFAPVAHPTFLCRLKRQTLAIATVER